MKVLYSYIRRTSFLHIHPIGSVQNSSSYAKTYYRYPVEFYGAIISLNSTLVILDSAFEGSKVGSIGGAIYTERNDLVIKRCNFSFYTRSCKHQCYGGALFAINSRVAISVSNFIGNEITYFKPSNRDECRSSSITRGGALGFIDSTVMIDQTNFFDNSACTGGAVHTLRGVVSILSANFMQNRAFSTGSGVSAIAAACVYINNCNFTFNFALREGTLSILDSVVIVNNSNFYHNMAGNNGGAIKTTNKATVIVSQSMILDNRANHTGGGIYATYNSTILLERSILKHNFARKAGGGIKTHHDSKLHFWDKVIIKNNAAYYGGAVHMHFSSLISNCMLIITSNSAALGIIAFLYSQGHFKEYLILEYNAGSLFVFNSYVQGDGDIHIARNYQSQNFTVNPEVQEGGGLTCILGRINLSGEVSIEHNGASNGGAILAVTSGVILKGRAILSGNSATMTGGAIYVYHGEIVIAGCTMISNNVGIHRGGGIHSISSSLILIPDDIKGASSAYLYFVSNKAQLGGGVYLEVSSKIYLITTKKLLNFVSNTADYGGAIYVADETNNGTCTSSLETITAASESECFFQTVTPRNRLMTINESISFSNNAAKFSGSVLFGGLLDRCTVNALTDRHVRYSYLPGFLNDIKNFTNSDAVRVCFCKDSIADCNYQPEPIKVMKGREFSIELVEVDQTNNSLSGKVQSYLLEKRSSFEDGQWYQNVNSVCTSLTFIIYALVDTEVLHLHPEGPCKGAGISTRQLNIEFIPCSCPVGFEVSKENQHTCKCDCNTEIEQFVSACNATTSLLTRKGNSWFNKIKYHNETHFITYEYCPFDYCVPAFPEISINLSIPNGADKQCANDRSGILCGKCIPGHCLSLETSRCLERPSYWAVLCMYVCLLFIVYCFVYAYITWYNYRQLCYVIIT